MGPSAVPYGVRIAAGQPTPGFGIIERVNIYASLLWIAVLAIAVLHNHQHRAAGTGEDGEP
jgi:hypothetical protein